MHEHQGKSWKWMGSICFWQRGLARLYILKTWTPHIHVFQRSITCSKRGTENHILGGRGEFKLLLACQSDMFYETVKWYLMGIWSTCGNMSGSPYGSKQKLSKDKSDIKTRVIQTQKLKLGMKTKTNFEVTKAKTKTQVNFKAVITSFARANLCSHLPSCSSGWHAYVHTWPLVSHYSIHVSPLPL